MKSKQYKVGLSGIDTQDKPMIEKMSKLEDITNKDSQDGEEIGPNNKSKDGNEATIEDYMIQPVIPNKDEPSGTEQQTDFKKEMRKSFLAFEQVVGKQHDYEDYEEEIVEEIVVEDESQTLETTEELTEQVVEKDEEASQKDTLSENHDEETIELIEVVEDEDDDVEDDEEASKEENFHSEMRKSFAAFDALLGDNNEADDTSVADEETVDEASVDEFTVEETVAASSTLPAPMEQDTSFVDDETVDDASVDEFTVEETVAASATLTAPTEQDASFDEETIAESVNTEQQQRQTRKEEIEQLQNDMKKRFTAFESILRKQTEEEEEDDDDSHDEYTIEEETIDQERDDSKLFDKEMQKSFKAFESLLKQSDEAPKEDKVVGKEEEETLPETTVQDSSAAPKVAASSALMGTNVIEQSPDCSVVSSKDVDQKNNDAISVVKTPAASESKHDRTLDADGIEEEKKQTEPTTPSCHQGEEEEKKDVVIPLLNATDEEEEKKDDDTGRMAVSFDKEGGTVETKEQGSLVPDKTIYYKGEEEEEKKEDTTIGSMASFDKGGDNTEKTTKQEAPSGKTKHSSGKSHRWTESIITGPNACFTIGIVVVGVVISMMTIGKPGSDHAV